MTVRSPIQRQALVDAVTDYLHSLATSSVPVLDVVAALRRGLGVSDDDAHLGIRIASERGLVAFDRDMHLVALVPPDHAPPPRWRTVHFIPDPFLGGRIPIAVLVHVAGRVTVLRTKRPCDSCLGDGATDLVRAVVRGLEREGSDFDQLPPSVGPQVVLGDVFRVPDTTDPVAWVREAIIIATVTP